MMAQRFVSNNPQSVCSASGLVRVPQQPAAVPRRSGEALLTTTSIFTESSIEYSNHHSTRNLQLLRCLFHPSYGSIVYPKNPDRTMNYYRSVIRGYDSTSQKTLRSNMTSRDLQQFEDVIITEVWEGGGNKVSELARFVNTLQLMLTSEPALGRSVGWIPKDLGFQRHMIYPLYVKLGGKDFDAHEVRVRDNTSLESYMDKKIEFVFKLLRPQPLIDALLVMEGR